MLPTYSPSSIPITGNYIYGRAQTNNLLIDYEQGGFGISDTSRPLTYQTWKAEVKNLRDIWVSSPNTPEFIAYSTGYECTEVSLSFDQNMHVFLAFVENKRAKLFWYDPVLPGNSVMLLPIDARNPKLTMDVKESVFTSISDIILFYMRGTSLYCRVQRERFQTEHLIVAGIDGDLLRVGMNDKRRLQYQFGKKMTYDELINGELAKGSPIESSSIVTSDSSATPSDSDIWELERKD